MTIEFILSQTDASPMYQQIMNQIKGRIAVGDWPAGFALPSIRELAIATKVSVITVKQAYQELDNEGVIVTQHGRGSFVAESGNISKTILEEEFRQHLAAALKHAELLGLDIDQVKEELTTLSESGKAGTKK